MAVAEPRETIPPRAVVLLELAADALQMNEGRWQLLVEFRDGDYQWCEPTPMKLGVEALRRFERPAPQG